LSNQIAEERMLICRIRGGLCALSLSQVVETMRPLPTEWVAGAPPFVSGLAVIRGMAVPVVDAARLIGGGDGELGRARRFVTLDLGGRTVALAVDDVVGVRTLSASSRHDLPPLLKDAARESIDAVAALDSHLLLVLQAARLLPAGVAWASLPSTPPVTEPEG